MEKRNEWEKMSPTKKNEQANRSFIAYYWRKRSKATIGILLFIGFIAFLSEIKNNNIMNGLFILLVISIASIIIYLLYVRPTSKKSFDRMNGKHKK